MSSSDVETFNGKIVYNLDGSALIIDAGNATGPEINLSSGGATPKPLAALATTACTQSTACGNSKEKLIEDRASSLDDFEGQDSGSASRGYQLSPKIHSFRVVSAQDASTNCQDPANVCQTHKHKPILMCFICKLSFGTVNSFSLHANTEHKLNLEELDHQLLNREYSSAIIQRNMDEKPQISFLQPLDVKDAVETGESSTKDSNQAIPSLHMAGENTGTDELSTRGQIDCGDGFTGADISMSVDCRSSENSTLNSTSKSVVTFGSLNSATIKTNNPSASAPASTSSVSCISPASATASTPIQSPLPTPTDGSEAMASAPAGGNREGSPPSDLKASTDNIGSDKSNNVSQRPEATLMDTSHIVSTSANASGSESSPTHQPVTVDTPLTAADILQQHLLSLQQQQQQQQQQVVGSTGFPPMQAQTQLSSFHASLAALANEQNARGVKLLSEFLQQQLHQQQQKNFLLSTNCSDHPDFKGVDCKTCELIDIQHQTKSPATPQSQSQSQSLPQSQSQSQVQSQSQAQSLPQPLRSPNGGGSGGQSTSMPISPNSSSVNSLGNANASSFTIGACSDHINGRPQGVDCARCEMLLSSARLNSGVQMSTRNSCKTLKCPQCNWHYKYQETLEIHMREKHPDGESACGYCLAGQQHPRLARGESYSCGYKPYRCEICNYSTTTKGNLSIHMQSDKHLNNMQELNSSQNMAVVAAAAATAKLMLPSPSSQGSAATPATSVGVGQQQASLCSSSATGNTVSASNTTSPLISTASSASSKPKPSFRCDICSYETSVARNLRIHMTSEKHTHNMAVLQNNIKHIQAFNFLQQHHQQGAAVVGAGAANTSTFLAGPEVALADLAYNQALMIQLLQQNAQASANQQHQQQLHQQTSNSKLSPTSSSPGTTPDQMHAPFAFSPKPLKIPQGINVGIAMGMMSGSEPGTSIGEPTDSYPESLPDLWPTAFFSCLICDCFSTNDIEELNQHLLMDRSRQSASASADIMVIHNNNYICRLCNYKTNLKANFQLHSKTDKHLQKLNLINHIREGGSRNEYKLQYQPQLTTNVVQLKCNCCDFHTNSIQKLSLHTQQMRHDTMRMIFQHLLILIQKNRMRRNYGSGSFGVGSLHSDRKSPMQDDQEHQSSPKKALCCQLCNFVAKNLHEMVVHVKGLRHMQVEQLICLQRRSENIEMLGLNEVFKVSEQIPSSTEDSSIDCGLNLAAAGPLGGTTEIGFGVTSASSIDANIFSPTSVSSCATSCSKVATRVLSPVSTSGDVNSTVTTTIFKCNLCEYFVQSKKDIEGHIETMHPNTDVDEYISIPTNTAALQAFQTAVAAAALAAVQRCNVGDTTSSTTAGVDADGRSGDSDYPVDIKQERLDENEDAIPNRDEAKDNDDAEISRKKDIVSPETESMPQSGVSCPLCLESGYSEKSSLEAHLMSVHSVTRDGLARLLQLVNHKAWHPTSPTESASGAISTAFSERISEDGKANPVNSEDFANIPNAAPTSSSGGGIQSLSCQQCEVSFKHEEQLLQHAQQTQHFPMQNGEYLCIAVSHTNRPCFLSFATLPLMIAHFKDSHMSLVISERHVYKYRCKQCSLAFKTQEKLTAHMIYHSMRDATKCSLCQRNFRSTQALQKHMEQAHSAECTSLTSNSPRDLSPSCNAAEMEKAQVGSKAYDYVTTRTTESSGKASESAKQSPQRSRSPKLKDTLQIGTMLSPTPPDDPSTEQQQHFAVLTAALIKQQQDAMAQPADGQMTMPGDLHQFQGKTNAHSPFTSINQQSFQGLQSIQSLQQIQQQLSSAAAASGIPINPVDMLNLMQFHHLMSLNFMNLAPPLIFGANASSGVSSAAASGAQNNGTSSASTVMTSAAISERQSKISSNGSNIANDAANINIIPQANVTNNTQQPLSSNQKRARTRITDDQLKILRAHFDINNSPSEESIMEMSQKANLPMKVVKHWFRNTLFKERQRNKDSPYNFNNPPSTTLNLEEYERTGQAKVTSLTDTVVSTAGMTVVASSSASTANNQTVPTSVSPASSRPISANISGKISDFFKTQIDMMNTQPEQKNSSTIPIPVEASIKTEPHDDNAAANDYVFNKNQCQIQQQHEQVFEFLKQQQTDPATESVMPHHNVDIMQDVSIQSSAPSAQHYQNQQQQHMQQQVQSQQNQQTNCFETKSESGSSDVLSRPATPNSAAASNIYSSMNDLLNQQLENIGSNMGPPKKMQISGKSFEKQSGTGATLISSSTSACGQLESSSSNSSNSSSTSGGKRANRTRFTDYQIKVLQEFFENNSYPKDSDLEYLSKLLLLSPRVIVVWFQNARQKQRKIYENQPNNSLYESEEAKKQNINYACKKCSLVFQRYYELIRHQKNHCFKEENNKKSAKAQIAAAQIAHNLSSEDSNSSMDIHHAAGQTGLGLASQNVAAAVVVAAAAAAVQTGTQQLGSSSSPQHLFSKASSLTDFSPSTTPTPPQRERSNSLDQLRLPKFDCEKCDMQFNQLELLREHQLMHLMSPALFSAGHPQGQPEATYGPFGSILQGLQHAAQQQQQQQQQQHPPQQDPQQPLAKKRKFSESSSIAEEASVGEFETSQKKYEFLYQYFMRHETNTEIKQHFLLQQKHQQPEQQHHGNETDIDMEFLTNFYQQNELKRISSYDFLLQYYRKNEDSAKHHQHSFSSSKKPTIEFLLQYYQLNESKKFFQLAASPQTTPDGTESQPSSQLPNATTDEAIESIGRQKPSQGQKVKIEEEIPDTYSTIDNTQRGAFSDGLQEKINNNHINSNASLNENHGFEMLRGSKENDERRENLELANEAMNGDKQNSSFCESEINRKNNENDKPQYFQNLEDFLDATMIENNSQMLTFHDVENPSPKVENVALPSLKTTDCLPLDSSVQLSAPSKQNKRLRTTILPDQLNFLYECYQTESNPSRKMLEEISKKVNLKKRVVQVWFQNSRAKDKKSRNQRQYAHISDDNSFDGSIGKEIGNSNGNSNSNSNASKSKSLTVTGDMRSASTEGDLKLQDCQLCQISQVNMQKHAFSVEHICKMKEVLEQSSELYAHSNASGSDDTDCDRERRFYSLSKAFLLQHVVSSATSIASSAGNESLAEGNCLMNFDPSASATTTSTTTATANVATADNSVGTPSIGRRHLSGDIALSVNDGDEISDTSQNNQSGSRDLMQQLFNRNHITVIGGK